jgi:hypothetical protein
MLRINIILIVLLLFATAACAFNARPAALAGAFTAVADDAAATYWNPAGLGWLEKSEITATENKIIGAADTFSLLAAKPILDFGAGLAWAQKEARQAETSGTQQPNYYLLSLGRAFNQYVAIGANVKHYYFDDRPETSGNSFSPAILVNLGGSHQRIEVTGSRDESKLIQARRTTRRYFDYPKEAEKAEMIPFSSPLPRFPITLGLAIDDAWSQLTWATGTMERFFPKVRTGLAWHSAAAGLLSLEYSQLLQNGAGGAAAIGYEWQKAGLSIRLGYRSTGLCGGFGLESGWLRVDYAYDSSHYLSLTSVI